jgi:hypothetical protein
MSLAADSQFLLTINNKRNQAGLQPVDEGRSSSRKHFPNESCCYPAENHHLNCFLDALTMLFTGLLDDAAFAKDLKRCRAGLAPCKEG